VWGEYDLLSYCCSYPCAAVLEEDRGGGRVGLVCYFADSVSVRPFHCIYRQRQGQGQWVQRVSETDRQTERERERERERETPYATSHHEELCPPSLSVSLSLSVRIYIHLSMTGEGVRYLRLEGPRSITMEFKIQGPALYLGMRAVRWNTMWRRR
jgi:hypothetical protein